MVFPHFTTCAGFPIFHSKWQLCIFSDSSQLFAFSVTLPDGLPIPLNYKDFPIVRKTVTTRAVAAACGGLTQMTTQRQSGCELGWDFNPRPPDSGWTPQSSRRSCRSSSGTSETHSCTWTTSTLWSRTCFHSRNCDNTIASSASLLLQAISQHHPSPSVGPTLNPQPHNIKFSDS